MSESLQPPPAWKKVLAVGVAILLAWVAYRALTIGMADHYAVSDPARALSWRSDHPEALFRTAEKLAEDPAQADAAADFARRALRVNPLDGRPYRVLAMLAIKRGDRAQAAKLFRIAVARAPRDLLSQAWLLDFHLAEGNLAGAMQNLDLMLRVQPGLFPRMEPLLLDLVSTPAAHVALADRLAKMPPWRARLLQLASDKSVDVDAVAPLFDLLRKGASGLAPGELAAWVERLGREGRWGQAYLVWVNQLPPDRLAGLGNVFNGGFEWEPGQGGFDWRMGRVAGARMDRLPADGAEGRLALRLAFDDRRVPFSHLIQFLALPPGRYRLTGQARPENLRTERGLVWSVSCTAGGQVLGESEALRGNGPWRSFEARFEVPPAGCAGQRLMLRLPARIPAEQRIGGRVWFDGIRIVRD